MFKLRRVLALLLLWAAAPAWAANYTFPGNLPAGCSGSNGSYSCGALTLGYHDTVTIAAPKPATITVNGAMYTDTSTINAGGTAADLTLIVTGTLTIAYHASVTANIQAGALVDGNGQMSVTGSIATTTGALTLDYASTVTGSLSSTSGAITVGQSNVIGGSVTSGSGPIAIGYAAQVSGAITTAGSVSLAQASVAQACVRSTGAASITLGYQSRANGVCCGTQCGSSCVANNSTYAMPALCAAAVPTPLLEYRFDESSWSGSSGEVIDSSGSGYHGTAAGLATTKPSTANASPAVAGSPGSCRYGVFNRSNKDHVALPASFPNLGASGSAGFTITAWIRSSNVGLTGQRIFVDDEHGYINQTTGFIVSLGDRGSGTVNFKSRATNSGSELVTANVVASNSWYFVAASVDMANKVKALYVFDASGTQLAAVSTTFTASTFNNDPGIASIGGETNNAAGSENTNSFGFAGNIDELRVYAKALSTAELDAVRQLTRTCPVTVDHYQLVLASSSLACLPTTVTVTACADSSSPCTNAATSVSGQGAALATSAGTLAATSLVFGATGSASTTLSHPAAANGATASVTLSGEQTTAAGARQCCPNGSSCAAANSCATSFNTAGFIVASAANGAAATLPTQTAGTASATHYLRAVQTNTSTQACEAALTGAASVNWAYQCNNPSTCSSGKLMSVTGSAATAIAGNPASGVSTYTAVPMSFDANGNAPFSINFADVGQATLWVSKTVASAPLAGSSNAFVTRPAGFALSNIRQSAAPNLANPAAGSAAGAKFVKAGESFSATVTAQTAGGAATPNFGREAVPEGVLLTPTLVLPAAGAAGALSNATVAGGAFAAGAATVSNLAYSEVGIVTLTPGIADGSYLGTGNVTGPTTGNLGRFVPAGFALSGGGVTHRAAAACALPASFTHLGESFRLGFTLTAQNTSGATTQNYTGSFAKLDPANAAGLQLAGRAAGTVFSTANGRLSLGSASGSWSNGVAAGIGLSASALRLATPDGPHNAVFGIAPTDSDGVAMAAYDLDADAVAGNEHAGVASVVLRFGRLRLGNAYGSELLKLPLALTTEYWNGSAFVRNTLDDCTSVAAPVAPAGMGINLANAGSSSASVGSIAQGQIPFSLSAPGAGHGGSVDLTVTAPAWLQYNWLGCRGQTANGLLDDNPCARASFGRYKAPITYLREVF